MTILFRPIVEYPFDSTARRFFNMFQPIQETSEKPSDFMAFVLTPFVDGLVLDPLFALNASIGLINSAVSIAKACYYWSVYQHDTQDLIDERTADEINAAVDHLCFAAESLIAQVLNTVFSTLSWITRPIVSLLDECIPNAEYERPTGFPEYL